MGAGVRSVLSHVRLVAAIAVLFLAGAFTSSAWASQSVTIDQSPTQPVVGESEGVARVGVQGEEGHFTLRKVAGRATG